jgi:hypothetical protein
MVVWTWTFSVLGADVGAAGAGLLPRGPFPNSARLLKLFAPDSGTALRFTIGEEVASVDLPCDNSESFRASSLACFDVLLPISSLSLVLRSDLGGGGGGRSFTAESGEAMD